MIAYRPSAPLDLFVDRLWWNDRARAATACEHLLPSGKAQLVIALHDEPFAWSANAGQRPSVWRGGIVHGPQSSYFITGPKPPGRVMGVSFRAGSARAVFGVPASELADRHVTVDELWGSSGRDLRERLAAAPTPAAAFALLELALLAHLRRRSLSPPHPAVVHALRVSADRNPLTRVAQLQRETGYSAKHFSALFRAAVGLTPKHYLRIQRFGNVLQRLAAGPVRTADTLGDIAALGGYSDQSHMTREFREFAGISPTQYRPQGGASRHHHLAAESAPGKPLW